MGGGMECLNHTPQIISFYKDFVDSRNMCTSLMQKDRETLYDMNG